VAAPQAVPPPAARARTGTALPHTPLPLVATLRSVESERGRTPGTSMGVTAGAGWGARVT
jgi:hypothetical protein